MPSLQCTFAHFSSVAFTIIEDELDKPVLYRILIENPLLQAVFFRLHILFFLSYFPKKTGTGIQH